MASRKSFLAKQSYIFEATPDTHLNQEGVFEFDEAEVWNNYPASATEGNNKKKGLLLLSGSRRAGSRSKVLDHGGGRLGPVGPASLPVNIPDWSKILKEDYKEHPKKWPESTEDEEDQDEEEDGNEGNHGGIRVPPHEYLARTRGASLSVHEGIGRTLKGRDLRSVRNAIWKKVGFED